MNDEFDIVIIRKKIKNIYLRVLPPKGVVQVTAPLKMSDDFINSFILSKREWIQKQIQEISQREYLPAHEYKSGEYLYLWGEKHQLEVIFSAGEPEVWMEDNKINLKISSESTIIMRKTVLENWYRNILAIEIKKVLPVCCEKVGKKPLECKIKYMKTRWGTCNIKEKRIWLNLQLVKQPKECLSYVMIHELVHLYERNHNDRFKAYMDEFCPEWRKIKEQLRIER